MKTLFCVLLVIGFISAGVFAQPELDATFGSGGRSVVVSNFLAYADDIAIQPDNKIILASSCRTMDSPLVPFCLARMNEDGTMDSTFKGGVPNTSFGGVFTSFAPMGSGSARGIALQGDGKVIAVGSGPGAGSGQDVALIRYNADGSLDPSFGTGGIVFTLITGVDDRAEKIVLQPDGKILIVGTAGSMQFVARYLSDGTLDTSFGTGGMSTIPVAVGSSIALQPDGKIVAGGAGGVGYLLIRLNSDGTPDTTWDGDGILSVPASGNLGLGFRSIGLQLDGRVVALGHGNIIYRFNADGSLDTSFDGDGSRQALNGTDKVPYSLMVSASGKITVIGTGIPPACSFGFPCPTPDLRYFTARYKQDGSLDTSFSGDGYLEIDVGVIISAGYNGGRTIAVDPIGRVVFAGVSSSCCIRTYWESPRFSAARLAAPPPRPVSVSGRVTDANGNGVSGVTVSTQGGLSARTTPFGFYTLNNVETNKTYIFSVRSKTDMAFGKRTILVDDQISGLDFVGEQLDSRTIRIDAPAPKSPGPSIRKLR
ncbi:MAG TPA: hypothetical protein VGO50_04955 [Pyrinomonadaceae bacterium]|jgi:uncharacterized delta-60 repeat protein|nr:hypothetical protein [Pyrinomonadaceae bacterium]